MKTSSRRRTSPEVVGRPIRTDEDPDQEGGLPPAKRATGRCAACTMHSGTTRWSSKRSEALETKLKFDEMCQHATVPAEAEAWRSLKLDERCCEAAGCVCQRSREVGLQRAIHSMG
eukprot:TRINITY_DN6536_c0_g1_i6.p2 TRINITY_DN6536_c0_g1~~TRINITY_DN6536_c0_g1_i6.p2  ORF type:complete len:116 (+),score=8.60 TRINITY_DN6536_c0_g1_i6:239-586(+)